MCDNAESYEAESNETLTIYRPAQAQSEIFDPDMVRWEFEALRSCDLTFFWFPQSDSAKTSQPIALYELGYAAGSAKNVIVGAHEAYPRRSDVVAQLSLARPSLVVHNDLIHMVALAAGLLAQEVTTVAASCSAKKPACYRVGPGPHYR